MNFRLAYSGLVVALSAATTTTTTLVSANSEPECQTIAEIACSSNDFTILCEALQATGLDVTLDSGTYTVFAPTNQAFEELLTALDLSSVEDIPLDTLSDVLLLHAVADKVLDSTDITDRCGQLLIMANGKPTRTICKKNGNIFQNGVGNNDKDRPKIIQTDIEACNGIIHAVDEVILPMSLNQDPDKVPPEPIVGGDVDEHGCIPSAGYSYCEATDKCYRPWEEECPSAVGGDVDEHGCIPSAGYSYCEATDKCYRPWEEECPSAAGGDRDEHGCIPSAGYSYCEATDKCYRPWEEDCPSITGGDVDEHGCIPSAGYSYCEATDKCYRPWEEDCPTITGGDRDEHGCIPSAGYSYCEATDKCYRPWEEECPSAPECESIAKIACGADDFEILCSALKLTGLDELLDGPGPWTVFAPTDDGFLKLLGEKPYDALEELSTDTLTDLLAYHVVDGTAIYFDELKCDESLEMYNSEKTTTECWKEYKYQIGGDNQDSYHYRPKITLKDIKACNGVIQAVDDVILPKGFLDQDR